jgi:hypothetical protein
MDGWGIQLQNCGFADAAFGFWRGQLTEIESDNGEGIEGLVQE